MRNTRTVKAAYWDLFFFCKCFVFFGVGRRLGYPSGGLWCGWVGTRDGRKDLGRWSCLRVPVFVLTNTGHPIWLEPPRRNPLSPTRTGLIGMLHVLLRERVNVLHKNDRTRRLTVWNVLVEGPLWFSPQQWSGAVRDRSVPISPTVQSREDSYHYWGLRSQQVPPMPPWFRTNHPDARSRNDKTGPVDQPAANNDRGTTADHSCRFGAYTGRQKPPILETHA